jgi:hypothetical protein
VKNKLIILTFTISSLLLAGCYVERPHGYASGPPIEASYSYVYYPDAEVYFEPHSHVYYWSEAGAGAWRSGARVPQNIVLRSHVTVNLNSPEPYKHHDEVKMKYPRQNQAEEREKE